MDFVQDRADGFAVMTVLERGQSSATFAGLLKPGQRLEPSQDGGLAVLEGNDMVASVDAPWATDSVGRTLQTSSDRRGLDHPGRRHNWRNLSCRGRPVHQDGLPHRPCVLRPVHVDGNELHQHHIAYSAPAVALLCSKTGAAAPFCAFFGAMFIVDVTNVTKDAIAHKRCLKQRLPANTGAIGIPAYDSYYVACTS